MKKCSLLEKKKQFSCDSVKFKNFCLSKISFLVKNQAINWEKYLQHGNLENYNTLAFYIIYIYSAICFNNLLLHNELLQNLRDQGKNCVFFFVALQSSAPWGWLVSGLHFVYWDRKTTAKSSQATWPYFCRMHWVPE